MKTGLFGGTFDPPHLGHRLVAEKAIESLHLDRVIWMPANRSPHKPDQVQTDAHHRLAMTSLAVAGDGRFSVSDLEMRRPAPSFMVDTLEMLHADLPHAEFYLIIGEDSLAGFANWRQPERIQDLARLSVYPRHGDWDAPTVTRPVSWIDSPPMDVSSTTIRDRLERGLSVESMVAGPVVDYARAHGLYGS